MWIEYTDISRNTWIQLPTDRRCVFNWPVPRPAVTQYTALIVLNEVLPFSDDYILNC